MFNPHCFRRALMYLLQRPPDSSENNDHNRHGIFIVSVGQSLSQTNTIAVYVPSCMTVFVLQMLNMHFIDFLFDSNKWRYKL
jgi:hypothetical protein